jgi:hypothetical protein
MLTSRRIYFESASQITPRADMTLTLSLSADGCFQRIDASVARDRVSGRHNRRGQFVSPSGCTVLLQGAGCQISSVEQISTRKYPMNAQSLVLMIYV